MTTKQVTAAVVFTLAVAAFDTNAGAEEKFRKLTGAQIRTTLAGMEITDEVHWGDVYFPAAFYPSNEDHPTILTMLPACLVRSSSTNAIS